VCNARPSEPVINNELQFHICSNAAHLNLILSSPCKRFCSLIAFPFKENTSGRTLFEYVSWLARSTSGSLRHPHFIGVGFSLDARAKGGFSGQALLERLPKQSCMSMPVIRIFALCILPCDRRSHRPSGPVSRTVTETTWYVIVVTKGW
jgi:hypothetical protein